MTLRGLLEGLLYNSVLWGVIWVACDAFTQSVNLML